MRTSGGGGFGVADKGEGLREGGVWNGQKFADVLYGHLRWILLNDWQKLGYTNKYLDAHLRHVW